MCVYTAEESIHARYIYTTSSSLCSTSRVESFHNNQRESMASHPKWHLPQNLLILLPYTAALVAFSTLTLPLLASSQTIDFKRTCVGLDNLLQLCVGAKPPPELERGSLPRAGYARQRSLALGKGRSAQYLTAKATLPRAASWALGKGFAEG